MAPRQQSRSRVVWTLFSLHTISVLLLLACLGVLVCCSVGLLNISYALVGILLLWDVSSFIRTYFLLSDGPGKIEAGSSVSIEVLMMVAACFGGVGTLLRSGYSHQRNGNPQCDPSERVAAQGWEWIVVCMLFTTGYVIV